MTLIAETNGERLDAFLARVVPDLTRSAAQKLIEEGNVQRNGKNGKNRIDGKIFPLEKPAEVDFPEVVPA